VAFFANLLPILDETDAHHPQTSTFDGGAMSKNLRYCSGVRSPNVFHMHGCTQLLSKDHDSQLRGEVRLNVALNHSLGLFYDRKERERYDTETRGADQFGDGDERGPFTAASRPSKKTQSNGRLIPNPKS